MNLHGYKLKCKEITRATRRAYKESPVPRGRLNSLIRAGKKYKDKIRALKDQKNPTKKKRK